MAAVSWLEGAGNVTYFASAFEHALEVSRDTGEKLYLSVNHSKHLVPLTPVAVVYVSDDPTIPVESGTETLCGRDELNLVLMDSSREERIKEIDLSYAEARFLRALLLRPEVAAILDQEAVPA